MLGLLAALVLFILVFSGSLSVAEAVTSMIVLAFSALAYLLSTSANAQENAVLTEFAVRRREALANNVSQAAEWDDVRRIVEAYPQPALLTGHDGRVYVSNLAAREVFKLPRAGSLGPAIIRRADVLKRLQSLVREESPAPLDIEISGTPDRFFQVWTISMSIGNEPRVLLVLTELTELRRAEKARADFLANASHELRTPLTSLSGFIETMRGPAKDDPEAWDRFLEIMFNQTERMRRLIHDLLSLSRIELSEHHKPEKVIEFSSLVDETFEAMLPIANDLGASLDLVSSAKSVNVHGVRDELAQVLQNLIENALKYTQPNTSVLVELASGLDIDEVRAFTSRRWKDASRISILQSHPEPGTKYVAVRVSDEGAGIDREHLPRLGERFYRVDESRDRTVGGTGLGLAIVKHIIARHRGGFVVESEPGRGSAFGFWLPVASADKPPANQTLYGPDRGTGPSATGLSGSSGF